MQCLPAELIARIGLKLEDRDRAALSMASHALSDSAHEYVTSKTLDLLGRDEVWFMEAAGMLARLCDRLPMLQSVKLLLVQTGPIKAEQVPTACEFVATAARHFAAWARDLGRPPVRMTVAVNDCYVATTLLSHISELQPQDPQAAPQPLRLVLHKPHNGGDYKLDTLAGLAALPYVRIASLYTSFPSPAIATTIPCDRLSIFVNPNVFAESLALNLQHLACSSCDLVCNNIRAYTLDLPVLPPSLDTLVFANTSIAQSHRLWFQPERLQQSQICKVDFVNHRMPLLRDNLSLTLAALQQAPQKKVQVGVPAVLAHQVMDVLMAQARPHLTIDFLHNGTPVEYAMAVLASRILQKFGCGAGSVHARFMDFYGDVESPALSALGTSNADLLAIIEPSLAWLWGLLLLQEAAC